MWICALMHLFFLDLLNFLFRFPSLLPSLPCRVTSTARNLVQVLWAFQGIHSLHLLLCGVFHGLQVDVYIPVTSVVAGTQLSHHEVAQLWNLSSAHPALLLHWLGYQCVSHIFSLLFSLAVAVQQAFFPLINSFGLPPLLKSSALASGGLVLEQAGICSISFQ